MRPGTLAVSLGATVAETEALLEQILRLREPAYLLASRVLGPGPDAEDALQEACLEAVRRLSGGWAPKELRPWFLSVVFNAARQQLRSERRRRRREAAVQAVDRRGAAGAVEDAERTAALGACLAALDEKYRLPISLCYEQGLSQREAAEVLGLPEGTVFTNVNRGLERLRESLSRLGYAAAPAALLGWLAALPRPAMSAGLAAALESAMRSAMAKGSGSAAAAAAKGGLAMKVVAGVVLAGSLAGGVALFTVPSTFHPASPPGYAAASPPPSTAISAPPAAPAGKPVREHFAYCNTGGYLDGPRREALAGRRGCFGDAEDNIYSLTPHSYSLRVARQDGMAETIVGDDHWVPPMDAEEGPAAWLAHPKNTGVQGGVAMGAVAARGAPLAGPDKGAIYTATGPNSCHPDWYYRVWQNKDQGGRWWYKHVIGGGKAGPPTVVGQSAPALGVKLNAGVIVGVDGKLYLAATGTRYFYLNLYRYDEEKGDLTCVLAETDYKEKTGGASAIWPASDGGFFIWCSGGEGNKCAFRVSADRSKVEKIIQGYGYNAGHKVFDGPALKSGWFDGPQPVAYFPPDILFGTAVDDCNVRRYKDGRISSLCFDGEWREFTPERRSATKDTGITDWGRGWVMGKNSIYEFYYCSTGSSAIYKMSPIDFAKPSVGPQMEGTLKGGK